MLNGNLLLKKELKMLNKIHEDTFKKANKIGFDNPDSNQEELKKWLRDNTGFYVTSALDSIFLVNGKVCWHFYIQEILSFDDGTEQAQMKYDESVTIHKTLGIKPVYFKRDRCKIRKFNSYEDALEVGLNTACKILKNRLRRR